MSARSDEFDEILLKSTRLEPTFAKIIRKLLIVSYQKYDDIKRLNKASCVLKVLSIHFISSVA